MYRTRSGSIVCYSELLDVNLTGLSRANIGYLGAAAYVVPTWKINFAAGYCVGDASYFGHRMEYVCLRLT